MVPDANSLKVFGGLLGIDTSEVLSFLEIPLNETPDVQYVDVQDVIKATILSIEYMFDAGQLDTEQNREPFLNWVALIAAMHPATECREGAATLLLDEQNIWPHSHNP